MTKEFAIVARDHAFGIPQKRHYRMTSGGCLPLVPAKPTGPENDLSDFLLGRTRTTAIERL